MLNPLARFLPLGVAFSLVVGPGPVPAQRDVAGAEKIELSLRGLNSLGSVMMIAAHPDDENTALLAYFARGRTVRTAYLSLTRGEGGQNLIGPEQGVLLGVLRTQELLAARKIDGAEQFFTRAIDFGFSKTAAESLEKWGRERILSDVVWNIRRFRPDVIVLRFTGTPRDGHGQHQASAILGREAFTAAADASRFPEQLKYYPAWRAKRLMWNAFSFSRSQEQDSARLPGHIMVDTGEYSPLLGYSYAEIAGMSRSMHRSQAMGAPERMGSQKQYLVTVAGEPAVHDIFDGIDTTWRRLPGGAPIETLIAKAQASFHPDHPAAILPWLAEARPLMAAIRDPIAERKLKELDETMALAAGVWAGVQADRWGVIPGGTLKITPEVMARTNVPVRLEQIRFTGRLPAPAAQTGHGLLPFNQAEIESASCSIPAGQAYTQPYWLIKAPQGDVYTVEDPQLLGLAGTPPLLEAHFRLQISGQSVEIARPLQYRYVDRVRGQLSRAVVVMPPVAVRLPEKVLIFPTPETRLVDVELKTNEATGQATVRLSAPAAWNITPAQQALTLPAPGEQTVVAFNMRSASENVSTLQAGVMVAGKTIFSGMTAIDYPHIPPQVLFPAANAKLIRADIRTLARRVGYVMGAGDEVPEALRQIGCEVTLLTPDMLATGDLSRFDAVVTGVRAFNVRPDLRANQPRLLDYVRAGGTLVVQYNTLDGSPLDRIGPYPIGVTHARVSVEQAPVHFTNPSSPLLREPNRITERDFDSWIQERGLYFASTWAPEYKTLFESHDPNEPPQEGGILYTKLGKGAYVFTAYSWFRELPAGVPGAFRIFANLLSAGKTLP
ncbi:MAG: PIG-L family deacetylase [Bryobacterales bacterium]|nr:PIG-L family deacetylase [Bryobacterales bacterium]